MESYTEKVRQLTIQELFMRAILDGKMSGKGVIILKSGDRYEGDFLNDYRDGKGVQVSKDGSRYEGEFKQGKFHGKGKIVKSNGEMFDGYWENGKALSDQAATQTLSKTNAQSNMLQAKAACLNAKVPLIKSSNFGTTRTINNGTTEFYGDCKGNDAYTGFVIWKQNNKPFLLNFLDEGKYCPSCAFPVGNEKILLHSYQTDVLKVIMSGNVIVKTSQRGLVILIQNMA